MTRYFLLVVITFLVMLASGYGIVASLFGAWLLPMVLILFVVVTTLVAQSLARRF